MKNNFLFFGPESTIWSFISTHALLASLCASENNTPLLVRCTGQLFRCQLLNARGHSIEDTEKGKLENCASCIARMDEILAHFSLRHVDMATYVDGDSIRSIRQKVFSMTHFDPTLEYQGVPVGQLAIPDMAFDKISNYKALSPNQLRRCHYSLADSMLTVEFMQNMLRTLPLSAVVVYNPYTSNETARYVAHQAGIRSFVATHNINSGIDWRRISLLGPQREKSLLDHLSSNWSKVRHIPLSREEVFSSLKDSAYRTLGQQTIYQVHSVPTSTDPAEIMRLLSLDEDKKLLVAGTSSLDERNANNARRVVWDCPLPHDVLGSQAEWGQALLNMAEERPDLQLVIRVHPRDRGTAHHDLLRSLWHDLPTNCRIIWPEERISTYGLMELADVVLTAWTTLGLEAARLGIPAVQATTNFIFPIEDFLRGATTPAAYQACILSCLTQDPCLETFKSALRFDLWYRRGTCCDLGDFCQFAPDGLSRDFTIPYAAAPMIQNILEGKMTVSEHNIRQKLAQPVPAVEDETKAMQEAVAWYLGKLYFGGSVHCTTVIYAPSLRHLRTMQTLTQRSPNVFGLCFEGKKTVAFCNGVLVQRTSALAIRLAVMTGSHLTG